MVRKRAIVTGLDYSTSDTWLHLVLDQVPSPRGAPQIHILQFSHRPVGSWLHHGWALHPQTTFPRLKRSGHHFQDLPSIGNTKKSNHTHIKLNTRVNVHRDVSIVISINIMCVINLSLPTRTTGLKDISSPVQWISAGLSASPIIWRRWSQTPAPRPSIWWQTCCSGIPGRDLLPHK